MATDEAVHTQVAPLERASPSAREFGLQAWENRRPALLIAGGFLAVSLVVAACVPAHYRATATLAVLPAPEFTVRPDAGSRDQAATTLALDQVMKAETEILGSDDLHQAVLAALGPNDVFPGSAPGQRSTLGKFAHLVLAPILSIWVAAPTNVAAGKLEQELRRFRSDLLILPAKDSNIVAVSFTSKRPEQASAVVNTLLALYAVKRKELYDDPQLDAIRREKTALELQAAEADRQLTAFERLSGISDFTAQRAFLLQRASNLEQALADAKGLVEELEARTTSIQQHMRTEPSSLSLYRESDRDTRLQLASSALQDSETHYAEAAERYTAGSRVLASMRAQIEARRAAVQAMEVDRSPSVSRQGRNANLDQLELDHERASADLSAARSRLKSLTMQRGELASFISGFNQSESALHSLERDKGSAEENLSNMNRLLSDRHLTEAEDALRFANVRVIQPARVPQASQPLPIYIIASGLLLGLLSAGLWITIVFVRREVFLTEEGLANHFQIPVFATFSQETLYRELEEALQ